MKTIKLIIPVLVIFILQERIHAQFDGYSTHYFNYFSNLAYSNDVAEDVVMDDAANTYVAGERAKETAKPDRAKDSKDKDKDNKNP